MLSFPGRVPLPSIAASTIDPQDHHSGTPGAWCKLGPWETTVSDGDLELTSNGGHANFSGIEVWRGRGDHPDAPTGAQVAPEAAREFDMRIAPLLSRHCLGCHNGFDKKGGLDLAHHESALAGGDSGVVLVAGNPDESLLWNRVSAGEVPPDHAVSDEDKETTTAFKRRLTNVHGRVIREILA